LDAPSDDVDRPFLLDAEAQARPAAPLAGALALHIAAGLALVGIESASAPPAPVAPPIDAMVVTLVEPTQSEQAPFVESTAEATAAQAAATLSAPADFNVHVDTPSASPSPLAPLDYLRMEDPTATLGAPSEAVREALAQSLRCRPSSDEAPADCPAIQDRFAEAEAAGLAPRTFLDMASLAPYEGFNVVEAGPAAMVFTANAPGCASDIGAMPFRLVVRPRGHALTSADREFGRLMPTWC
jgi:hypothetical protein